MGDAKNLRERELKAAEAEMNRLQKKSEESRKQWKEREGVIIEFVFTNHFIIFLINIKTIFEFLLCFCIIN